MQTHLPQQLKRLRKRHKRTQKEVADALYIGQTTVANYENGTRVPDFSMCVRLADYYGVSLDQLAGRDLSVKKESPAAFRPSYTKVDYFQALYDGDKPRTEAILLDFLEAGTPSETIYFDLIEETLIHTGNLWAKGELPVWKEHLISEMVLENLTLIQRHRKKKEIRHPKRMLSLLPGAEQHGIGLRMIGALLEERGHESLYLGNHLPADHVLEAIETMQADAVLLSCTMPEHVDTTAMLIEKIRQSLKKTPLLLIGGTAFTFLKNPAEHVGADHYCRRFTEVLELLK